MSSAIGRRVKELRSYLKLTQVQFAENIGVKGGVVSAWEKGSAPLPYGRLLVICDAYHVSESWLKKGEGDMFDVATPEQARSNRDSAIEYVAAILRELPDETRRETADFIREILRRCELDEAVAASRREEKNVQPAPQNEAEEEDERVEIVSADEDFDDDDYEYEYEDEEDADEVEEDEEGFDDEEESEVEDADEDFDDDDDYEEFDFEENYE